MSKQILWSIIKPLDETQWDLADKIASSVFYSTTWVFADILKALSSLIIIWHFGALKIYTNIEIHKKKSIYFA